MGLDPVWLVDALALLLLLMAGLCTGVVSWRAWDRLTGAVRRRGEQRRLTASRHSIEDIGSRARRLQRRFHDIPHGLPYAKVEGIRRAYDDVLTEACGVLDIDHLLHVLAPGRELDAERLRVEVRLAAAGLALHDVH